MWHGLKQTALNPLDLINLLLGTGVVLPYNVPRPMGKYPSGNNSMRGEETTHGDSTGHNPVSLPVFLFLYAGVLLILLPGFSLPIYIFS